MDFDEQILNLVKQSDPRTWWREYPPKFIYQDRTYTDKTVKKHLSKIFNNKNKQPIGLYINIPFCRSRCLFCKFYSEILRSDDEIDNYLICLQKELELYNINFKKASLDNIYIGGGTPTALNEKQWKQLFRIIHKYFNLKKMLRF